MLNLIILAALLVSADGPARLALGANLGTPQTTYNSPAQFPEDAVGVLVRGSDWTELHAAMPKSHMKRGLAAALTYGVVPAHLVAQYDGQHADVQIASHQPLICVCRVANLPAAPLLVKLHSKKGYRELDAGRMPLLGAEVGKMKGNDLISVAISQSAPGVWLLRPIKELVPGEYAVVFGTENMYVFPFTVSDSAIPSADKS